MKKEFLKLTSILLAVGVAISMVQPMTAYAANPKTDTIQDGVLRVYGKSRYDTSFSITNELKKAQGVERFDAVIIASGKNFPDALAGSYLAAKKNAPILMTDCDPASNNTRDLYEYVEQNVIKEAAVSDQNQEIDVYILGGTGVVPAAIEEEFVTRGYSVKRLSGKDRYRTNLAILNEAGVDGEEILVCTGKTFADSLSASATGLPILLVDSDGKTQQLTAEQKAFLKKANSQITIIGGTGAVSVAYEAAMKLYDTDGTVDRISGASRYETSVKVAEEFCQGATEAVVAYAENFPDGLCGGPLAYTKGTPLILTKTGKESEAAKYTAQKDIHAGVVLGGASLISDIAAKKIFVVADKDYENKYHGQTKDQQAVIDTALNIFLNWDTKYAHNQSTGEKDVDGKYGFDCSGFVSYVMDTVMRRTVPTYNISADIEELYNTSSVYNKGLNGEFTVKTIQTGTLNESELQPGDVLFFQVSSEESQKDLEYNHCGIYLGAGAFIHCTHSLDGVGIMPLAGIYKEGFVAAKRYLPDTVAAADAIRYTNSQQTSVYETQDSSKDPIEILPAERQVKVLFTDNGNWAYVSYGTETVKTGFVLMKYLDEQIAEESQHMYVKNTHLKLYESYTTSSDYITVHTGTEVEYKGRYAASSYYKVLYDGSIYYVYAPDSAGGIDSYLTDNNALMNGVGTIEIRVNTKLRSSMSSQSDENLICMMYKGEQAVLIAQSPLNEEGKSTWSYIMLDNGTYGYVLTKYINITKIL